MNPSYISRQWEKLGRGKLSGFETELGQCRFRGTIYLTNASAMPFWARDVITSGDGPRVNFYGILIDTSTRFQGCTLEQRMTWYREMAVVNATVVILPFEHDGGGLGDVGELGDQAGPVVEEPAQLGPKGGDA